jgi:replicative DNA helicase
MKWFEIAMKTDEGFERNFFMPSEDREKYQNRYKGQEDVYFSVFDYEFDERPSSDSDFENAPKHGDLYFDLDSIDPAEAEKQANQLIEWFISSGVYLPHISKAFSGAKGYHVIVPKEYISNPAPENTHLLYKQIAISLADELKLDTLDTKVYDARRVLRIPNSVNSKTGKLKEMVDEAIPISDPDNIKQITLPEFLHPVEKREPVDMCLSGSSGIKQPLEPFFIRMLEQKPEEGERNNHAYTCSLYLKDHGYSPQEAYNLINESPTTLDRRELQTAVQSAYSGNKHFGMKDNTVAHSALTADERIKYNVDDLSTMLVPWGEVMNSTRGQIERFRKQELLTYGLQSIDNYLGMISSGELITVGGVSGIGKSEFVWNIAKQNARLGVPVAFIGIEMSPEMYTMRMLKNKMGVDGSKFKTLDFDDEERKSLEKNMTELEEQKLPIYFFNPKYQLDVNKLDELVKLATERFGIKLWIIDHLHYFPNTQGGGGEQTTAVSHIVTSIKQMTLKYDVPIVLVSHYRKLAYGTKPSLNSFKDSIAIPQVSDTVIALDRDLTSQDLSWQRRVEVSILKSRYGMASATFYADFDPTSGDYKPLEGFQYGLSGTRFD